MKRSGLKRCKRIVVKVGTSLLTPPRGKIYAPRFFDLAHQIVGLMDRGHEVVLVASGAVGLGAQRLGLAERPKSIPAKQAAAAVGQIDLCRRFGRAFAREHHVIGQILLTHVGLADRVRFLNARHTLEELLAGGIVPLINENDTVSTEELRFGDNDMLSALVVNTCSANLLILLTDTDGLHDRHPEKDGAERIAEVSEVTAKILKLSGGPGSEFGTGGMRSKLEAARTAARFGVPTVIADGQAADVLAGIVDGEDLGTLVHPAENQLSSRKHWIAFSQKPRGTLTLDSGAIRALCERRASLLPAGVVGVAGKFRVGDLVRCVTAAGREVARGLIAYESAEVEMIMGQRTSRISTVLGYCNGNAIIHRNDLIVL
ncbi:MAG: glutamate 5-kinase [bacterium]|nr:glutamate 5-kinase [bacterium]